MHKIFYFVIALVVFSCTEEKVKETPESSVISTSPVEKIEEPSSSPSISTPVVVESDRVENRATSKPVKHKPAKKKTPSITLEELKAVLAPKAQTFKYNTSKDTLITCVEGTKVYFPAHAFDTEVEVKVSIQENYTLSSFIANDLVTTSGDQLLETGGMLNIKATSEGKEVMLKKGKEYAVYFPKSEDKEGMRLFYGNTSSDTGLMDWESAEQDDINDTVIVSEESFVSICECYLDIVEHTSGFGKLKGAGDVDWELKDSDETVFTYFRKNFQPLAGMENDFCNNNLAFKAEMIFDTEGKVRRVYIENAATPAYDSVLTRFLYDMPAMDMTSMAPKYYSSTTRFTLGIRGKTNFDDLEEEFNRKFEEKYTTFEDSAMAKVDEAEMNYYMMTATKLGWINCDRFWDTPEKKVPYFVKTDGQESVKIILTFKAINSAMQGMYKGGKTKFDNLPLGQPVKVIGIKYDEEKPLLAVAETEIGKKTFKLNGFKEFSLSELKAELNTL